jgi:hypothetical protein
MTDLVASVPPAAPPAESQRGLECRKCGCRDLRVVYTRSGRGGHIVRRRECRHCGQRLVTWEKVIG